MEPEVENDWLWPSKGQIYSFGSRINDIIGESSLKNIILFQEDESKWVDLRLGFGAILTTNGQLIEFKGWFQTFYRKKLFFQIQKISFFFNQEKSSSAIKMQKLLIATYCLELKIFILILNHINFILSNRKGVVSMTSLPLLISILIWMNVSNHYPKLNFDIVLMDLVHGPIRIVYPIRWSRKLLLDVQILMGEEFQF